MFDQDLRINPVTEPLETQALVAELAAAALAGRVLPGLAGIDLRSLDVRLAEPAQDRPRHELRTIVRTRVRADPDNPIPQRALSS